MACNREVKGSNKSGKDQEVSHAATTKMFMDEASNSKRVRQEFGLFMDGGRATKDYKSYLPLFYLNITQSETLGLYKSVQLHSTSLYYRDLKNTVL